MIMKCHVASRDSLVRAKYGIVQGGQLFEISTALMAPAQTNICSRHGEESALACGLADAALDRAQSAIPVKRNGK